MRRNDFLLAPLASMACLAKATVLNLPMFDSNTYSVVEADIGVPAQTYRLLFDTGSATTWVYDANCAGTCLNSSGYARVGYDVNKSSAGKLTGGYADIGYLGGATEGPVVSDQFTIGSYSWNQTFAAASKASWPALAADGFLGLAFNTISEGGSTTLVETLMPDLDEPRFGIHYYGDEENASDDAQKGWLTIGGSRETEFAHKGMQTIPIVSDKGKYQVWRSNIRSVSSQSAGSNQTISMSLGNVVFDTGAAQLILHKDAIDPLYESLGWNWTQVLSGKRVLMCEEFNSTWSVSFTFDNKNDGETVTVTLTGDQLALPGFPAAKGACWPPFEPGDFTLLGKRFLKNFYSVFDFGSKEVASYKPSLLLGNLG